MKNITTLAVLIFVVNAAQALAGKSPAMGLDDVTHEAVSGTAVPKVAFPSRAKAEKTAAIIPAYVNRAVFTARTEAPDYHILKSKAVSPDSSNAGLKPAQVPPLRASRAAAPPSDSELAVTIVVIIALVVMITALIGVILGVPKKSGKGSERRPV